MRTPERLREIPVLLDKAPVRYSRTAAEACLKAADEIEALVEALDQCLELIRDMSRYRHAEEMALKNYPLFNEAPIKAEAALKLARGDQ